jgi:hypothetical protein
MPPDKIINAEGHFAKMLYTFFAASFEIEADSADA